MNFCIRITTLVLVLLTFANNAGAQTLEHFEARLTELRKTSNTEPLPSQLLSVYTVSNRDDTLLTANMMCAERNNKDVPQSQLLDFRWFKAGRDFNPRNKSSEPYLMGRHVVRPEYQSPIKEVVWQYHQLRRLGTQGRYVNWQSLTEVINKLAESRPWEKD